MSTPVYASHGGADGMVKVAWGRATAEKLKAKGLDLSFKEHSEMDHELGEEQARPRPGCLHTSTGGGGICRTSCIHGGPSQSWDCCGPSYFCITTNRRKDFRDRGTLIYQASTGQGCMQKESLSLVRCLPCFSEALEAQRALPRGLAAK